MDRIQNTLITAFVIALLFAPAASAQATAAKVEVVSGNGQLICPNCLFNGNHIFHPMVVKVSDANGVPIAGKTVNWGLVSFSGILQPVFPSTTVTDSNGLSVSTLYQGALQTTTIQTPFLQSVISASVDGVKASFTETMALISSDTGAQSVTARPAWFPGPPPTLTGPAGSPGTTPIQITVYSAGTAVPHVSVRIFSPEVTMDSGLVVVNPDLPSASCVTDPGADPGSVLTDTSGNATCYPVFGPVAGSGNVSALVGGLDPIEFDQSLAPSGTGLSGPTAYAQATGIQLVVTPVTAGLLTIVGNSNNQTVSPGQASAPLVVKVTDAAGAVSIAGQDVSWTVSPAGAAVAIPSTSTTDSTGQAQTTVTFSANATGQVAVKAALTGSSGVAPVTFTLTARVLIAQLSKVPGGDLQTTQAGQPFPSDLYVQVIGTNGQGVANQPVGFAVTSSVQAALSSSSKLTDASGIAHVTVTAGSAAGTVTVSASTGNLTPVVFTLTIIPLGPALLPTSFHNAGGLAPISALSPCGLVTVIASGLAPNVQGMLFNSNSFGPWATTLATDTVTVNSVAAPIYSVGTLAGVPQLTFQVPCETVPTAAVPITISVAGGTDTITLPVVAAGPGIFETVMSDGVRRAVVIRPDGSFVSLQNPARTNETCRVFVTSMGPTAPALVTGAQPYAGTDSLVLGQIIVGVNNGGAGPNTARVSPNLIGVYEVSFVVPPNAPAGNDVVLSVAVNVPGDVSADGKQVTRFSNGSKLPIAQ